jgi:hypothetical protein
MTNSLKRIEHRGATSHLDLLNYGMGKALVIYAHIRDKAMTQIASPLDKLMMTNNKKNDKNV